MQSYLSVMWYLWVLSTQAKCDCFNWWWSLLCVCVYISVRPGLCSYKVSQYSLGKMCYSFTYLLLLNIIHFLIDCYCCCILIIKLIIKNILNIIFTIIMLTLVFRVAVGAGFLSVNLCSPCPMSGGARCSSVVRTFAHGAMGCQIDPSWGGPIELFLVPASAPRLV